MLAPVSRAFSEDIFKEFTAHITRYIGPNPAERGLWLKKSVQGKRLGRETIALLVQWEKYNLALSHLIYFVDKNNIPS